MAVFISPQLRPTSPNAAYTRLGYVVSSSNTDLPQYQYVLDVYESGSSNMVSRLVQTPNIISSASFYLEGVFDPSRIFQGELDFDNNWKVTGSIGPVNAVKTFELKAGEQYGTSTSSSITVYPDQDTATITVFPAVINPTFVDYDPANNEWDFNTGSFIGPSGDYNPYLTNNPATIQTLGLPVGGYPSLVNSTDYETVTIFEETYIDPALVKVYASKIETGSISGNVWTGSIALTPPSGAFNTIGVGPQNLADNFPDFKTLLDSGSINHLYTFNDAGGYALLINDKWDGSIISAEISPYNIANAIKQCSDEYTRFAFINKYGFWDYYNIYNPVRTTTALERQNYNPTQLSYQYGFQTRYNPFIPQHTQYFLRSKDSYVIDTDYIDKETANWLEELLESPEVYIQEGSDFVPIVITNSTYEHNNSTSRNKLFQYTIEWVYANPRRSRL